MKFFSATFALLLLTVFITPVSAARPKGLEDRGPLTKLTFIHYKKNFAKPPWAGGGGGITSASSCYSFLAKGAFWKTPESYLINPTNSYGLSDNFVENAVTASENTWESEAGQQIFGSHSFDYSIAYDENASDGMNSLSFGSYSQAGVIAVTNVWGYFGGPPSSREIVEWDMLLNTGGGWDWGDASADNSLMDVENIIAHELGHAAGMGHPDSTCVDETMFAYSNTGETTKRDLNTGDTTGIFKLYN